MKNIKNLKLIIITTASFIAIFIVMYFILQTKNNPTPGKKIDIVANNGSVFFPTNIGSYWRYKDSNSSKEFAFEIVYGAGENPKSIQMLVYENDYKKYRVDKGIENIKKGFAVSNMYYFLIQDNKLLLAEIDDEPMLNTETGIKKSGVRNYLAQPIQICSLPPKNGEILKTDTVMKTTTTERDSKGDIIPLNSCEQKFSVTATTTGEEIDVIGNQSPAFNINISIDFKDSGKTKNENWYLADKMGIVRMIRAANNNPNQQENLILSEYLVK